jgi:hypothetical protein
MTSETLQPDSPAPAEPTPQDTLRARLMFLLAFGYLLLLAGLLHRATS